jgi:hypothetical protein
MGSEAVDGGAESELDVAVGDGQSLPPRRVHSSGNDILAASDYSDLTISVDVAWMSVETRSYIARRICDIFEGNGIDGNYTVTWS